MNDTFQCGDPGALVAYLYDECDPSERELIAAHITRCATCASEIDALGATRRTLAAWTPPELALGFQITRAHDVGPAADQPARVLEPKIAWWRAPLPAWAQAAAALVIFAAGLSLGVARNTTSGQTAPREAGLIPSATGTTTNVSREELAQLEQRLRTEMSQMRTPSSVTTSSATPSSAAPESARSADALMAEVKALIAQGNEEQNRDFTLRLVDLASDFDIRNRRVLESVGQLQGAVRTEFGQQRQVNEQLLRNVSDQRSR
jgi:hypothetical protein